MVSTVKKLFWASVLILVVAGAALAWQPKGESPPPPNYIDPTDTRRRLVVVAESAGKFYVTAVVISTLKGTYPLTDPNFVYSGRIERLVILENKEGVEVQVTVTPFTPLKSAQSYMCAILDGATGRPHQKYPPVVRGARPGYRIEEAYCERDVPPMR